VTRILLVWAGANFDVLAWIDRSAKAIKHQPAYVAPLPLATLAALTPDSFEVQIWDEMVQGPVDTALDEGYELIGITGYSDHLPRGLKIADMCRERNLPVVIGGAGVTAAPHQAEGRVDAIFIGEAERTWPEFLEDYTAGTVKPLYESQENVDLANSPPPRWDSIADIMPQGYKSGTIETSRGCPFNCEFCDVWLKFGRVMRTKPVDKVMEEVTTQERIGMKRVMFATDNFIGSPPYAKQILRALIPLNNSFDMPLSFSAELSLNVARDPELLDLLAQANFVSIFIGLETTNLASLKETRKRQNTPGDMIEECRRVSSYGMAVVGSMIVGFDNDTEDAFDQQFEFLQEAYIPIPRLNILKALDGTDLVTRMQNMGRLIDMEKSYPKGALDARCLRTNMTFTNMSRAQVYKGFLRLHERVWDWENFRDRIIGFIDNVTNQPDRAVDARLLGVVEKLRPVMREMPMSNAAIVDEILDHALTKLPNLAWNVAAMTMLQSYHATQMPNLRETLTRQIEIEEHLAETNGYVYLPPLGEREALSA
jgi:radical SAM superfamily enzyme YgiQ (UPF0313 family)